MSHYEPEEECSDYECLVCSELQLTVLTCSECSILLCGNCLPSVTCCPQCKSAPTSHVFVRNAFVEKHIKTIKVRCTLCSWAGDFADFRQVHTGRCENVVRQCRHRKCSFREKRGAVTEHEILCKLYLVRCEFCDTVVQHAGLQEHQQNCEESEQCELCHQYQLRSSLVLHTHPNLGWCEAVPVSCTRCEHQGQPLAQHYKEQHGLQLRDVVTEVLLSSSEPA